MKTTLLSLAVILSLGLIGCSDVMNSPVEPQSTYTTYNPYEGWEQSGQLGERPGSPDTTKKDTVRKAPVTPFRDLIALLKITKEQAPIVEKLIAEHKACVEGCVSGLKNAEREILMNGRTEEAKIKELLKKGEITGEQARRELRQLRESTQTKLKSLPKDKVRECVKSCDETFIAKLKEILTTEQKIILEKWLVSREKRGTGDTGGGPTDGGNPKGRG